MDCEKFESSMMDELYGELDELTSAAAKRHVGGCARCAARLDGLRATRRVATVPLVEPPSDLEERIRAAAEQAAASAPSRPGMARVISLAGSWAMRPQTAMAAVFLVMIGTSVLLLRGKSARAPVSAEVTVIEQGSPAPAASVPAVAAPLDPGSRRPWAVPPPPEAKAAAGVAPTTRDGPTAAVGAGASQSGAGRARAESPPPAEARTEQPDGEQFDAALRSYRAGRYDEAARAFDALAPTNPNAPDLWAARAIRDGKGCRAAVPRFNKTAQRYKQTPPGWDALLEGALCYRALGDFGTARARLNALLGVDSHKDRARAELDRIDQLQQAQVSDETQVASKAASRPRPAAAAPAAVVPAAAAPPAAPPANAAGDSIH
jgi:TolA-binding protein